MQLLLPAQALDGTDEVVFVEIAVVVEVCGNMADEDEASTLAPPTFYIFDSLSLTIDTEGVRRFYVAGGALAEDGHHVKKVLKGHVAAVVLGKDLADALAERVYPQLIESEDLGVWEKKNGRGQ